MTYAFLHFGFFHLLFNMYLFYWFGRIVLNLFNEKRLLTVYLLGAMSGGLLYMLAYNIFPVFAQSNGVLLGGLALFLLDLGRISVSSNPGGLLSHVGGAIFGYTYAIQLAKGKDIGKWFENGIAWFQGIFTPRKSKPLKTVHRKDSVKTNVKKRAVTGQQKKIDAILDKIGKSGYDSLTKAEKDFLFKAGKDD